MSPTTDTCPAINGALESPSPSVALSPMENHSVTGCVECGSKSIEDRGPCRPYGDAASLQSLGDSTAAPLNPGRLYHCRSCGLGFRQPRPSNDELARLYSQLGESRWKYDPNRMGGWRFALEYLPRQMPPEPRVLDIGAFDGAFLLTLPDHWKKFAIEPAVAAHDSLKSHGIQVLGRFLESPTSDQRNRFDAVTLFDVLEHLEFPGQALTSAFEFVAPGGVLLVFTGNCEHWSWRALRGNHWYLDSVQHIRFASRSYFQNWANRTGAILQKMVPLCHQIPDGGKRRADFLEVVTHALYARGPWGRRASNWLRWITGMPLKRETVPYTTGLTDHVMVVFQKPA